MTSYGKRKLQDVLEYDDATDKWITVAEHTASSKSAPTPAKRARKQTVQHESTPAAPSLAAAQSSGSGSRKSATSTPKTPRAPRTPKDPDAPKPEKRAAIFKKKCPQVTLERVDRVMEQRFFMVDRRRQGAELREEFSVLGSTGNVYTVVIDKVSKCSCPDSQKGNHCKHILFIFMKVLGCAYDNGLWYQKALLTSELETIFSQARAPVASVTNHALSQAYARATGKTSTSAMPAIQPQKRIPEEGDDCAVCYEGMHGVAEKQLVFCQDCGKALHSECFKQWKGNLERQHKELTCVWCRAKWVGPTRAGAAGGSTLEDGYLNLASAAGVSKQRDTSSYYNGPRRGQRYYGYQEYNSD